MVFKEALMRRRKSHNAMALCAGMTILIVTKFLIGAAVTTKEKVYYLDIEAINMTYWNQKYYRDCNVTSKRFGRSDPIHYIHVHGETLVPLGNNVLVDVFVHEFLSNEYRRSFVEMHYKLCDMLFQDKIFSQFINKDMPKTCPIPKGIYHLTNMSIPDLPLLNTFPFRKGRIFSYTKFKNGTGHERLVEGYADVVIKERWRKTLQ